MDNKVKTWIEEKKKLIIKDDVIQMEDIISLITEIKSLFFPGYVEAVKETDTYYEDLLNKIHFTLDRLLSSIETIEEISLNKDEIVYQFEKALPDIEEILQTDIQALYDGDPAASSKTEIILCYPGLTAIFVYRIAHILYTLQVPILPRALSEYAHSKTGIDIHPGATIGSYFFIDHGTGIVVGQTCEIGQHVKIYQGVTLGALSLREGQKLKGSKRHPTIEDNVTIYSGASIFGGDTIIGRNATIGSSAFITSSVEADMVVTIQGQKKKHKAKDSIDEN